MIMSGGLWDFTGLVIMFGLCLLLLAGLIWLQGMRAKSKIVKKICLFISATIFIFAMALILDANGIIDTPL